MWKKEGCLLKIKGQAGQFTREKSSAMLRWNVILTAVKTIFSEHRSSRVFKSDFKLFVRQNKPFMAKVLSLL